METVKSAGGTLVACEGADDGRALVVGVGVLCTGQAFVAPVISDSVSPSSPATAVAGVTAATPAVRARKNRRCGRRQYLSEQDRTTAEPEET